MNNMIRHIKLLTLDHRRFFILCVCLSLLMCLIPSGSRALSFGDSYSQGEYITYCGADAIGKKFANSKCWSCDVVSGLMWSSTAVAESLFTVTQPLALSILLWCSLIWLAMYFLKILGSFAAQDVSKIIDGFLTFMFKVTFIYLLVASGLDQIVAYIVNPLLSIGMDVAASLGMRGGGSIGEHAGYRLTALDNLALNITSMAEYIHDSSSEMLKFADMLLCNAQHGKDSYITLSVAGLISVNIHAISLDIFLSGLVLYVLGFFIMMMASFYMFDVAFNLSLALMLLPLGLALWPFAWTRDKLKILIQSIVYYTGVFIFLPIGIFICVGILANAIESFASAETLQQAFEEDNSDLIRENLGPVTLGFLMVLLSYLVSFKVIPLMATEFCNHFFGGALMDTQLGAKINQLVDIAKQRTIGRIGNYMKDVAKHQTGNLVKSMGKEHGNLLDRAVYNYGKKLGNTKKK